MRKAELVELSFEDLSSATTVQGEGRRCERQVRGLHRQKQAASLLGLRLPQYQGLRIRSCASRPHPTCQSSAPNAVAEGVSLA